MKAVGSRPCAAQMLLQLSMLSIGRRDGQAGPTEAPPSSKLPRAGRCSEEQAVPTMTPVRRLPPVRGETGQAPAALRGVDSSGIRQLEPEPGKTNLVDIAITLYKKYKKAEAEAAA